MNSKKKGEAKEGWRCVNWEDCGGKSRRKDRRKAVSGPSEGSASPADIVSMLLTSKDWDYDESEGLQTMGGEENNIKVSRAFELR